MILRYVFVLNKANVCSCRKRQRRRLLASLPMGDPLCLRAVAVFPASSLVSSFSAAQRLFWERWENVCFFVFFPFLFLRPLFRDLSRRRAKKLPGKICSDLTSCPSLCYGLEKSSRPACCHDAAAKMRRDNGTPGWLRVNAKGKKKKTYTDTKTQI